VKLGGWKKVGGQRKLEDEKEGRKIVGVWKKRRKLDGKERRKEAGGKKREKEDWRMKREKEKEGNEKENGTVNRLHPRTLTELRERTRKRILYMALEVKLKLGNFIEVILSNFFCRSNNWNLPSRSSVLSLEERKDKEGRKINKEGRQE